MTPIDFGGGMIFPNSYDRDPPDPPECPCEDGEPCPVHRTCDRCDKPYEARHPEDDNGLCWHCESERLAALPPIPGLERHPPPASNDVDRPF